MVRENASLMKNRGRTFGLILLAFFLVGAPSPIASSAGPARIGKERRFCRGLPIAAIRPVTLSQPKTAIHRGWMRCAAKVSNKPGSWF